MYPIYFDAKRPYKTGERRVPKAKAFEWPLAQDMAESAHRLGLQIFFEVHETKNSAISFL